MNLKTEKGHGPQQHRRRKEIKKIFTYSMGGTG
jgi:hypothetical protein